MAEWLKFAVISLLVGIAGIVMATASQWKPSSEACADTTDAFHIQRLHLAEDELIQIYSNKTLTYFFEQYSAFTVFIDELPLHNIFIGITLLSLALLLYRPLFKPLWLIRKFGDAGYITDGRNTREVVEEIRKRNVGNIPPVFPNGWFSLARTWELKRGEVKYLQALGQDFAVYRGEDGTAYTIDAYCPHLGANLGVVGKVKGDCIEFRGRTYRGSDGKCMDIANIDKKASDSTNTRAWPCVEVNNEIQIWHHAEGDKPHWFPREIDAIKTGKMKFHGYSEHFINAHVEEFSENGAEFSHITRIHGPFVTTGSDLRYLHTRIWDWIGISAIANWCQDKDEKHIGVITLDTSPTVFGYKLPGITVTNTQVGPSTAYLRNNLPPFGGTLIIITILPVEPMLLKLTNSIYTTSLIPRPIAKVFLYLENINLERDMMLYNYKTFQSEPALEDDSVVMKHRRWYSQFYSKNSPRYTACMHGGC